MAQESQLIYVDLTPNIAAQLDDEGSAIFVIPFSIASAEDVYFALVTDGHAPVIGRGSSTFPIPAEAPDAYNYTYTITLGRSSSASNEEAYDRASVRFLWSGAGAVDTGVAVELVVFRKTDSNQSISFPPNVDISTQTTQSVDKLTRITDENSQRLDRALTLPDVVFGEAEIPLLPAGNLAHLIAYQRNDDGTYSFEAVSTGSGGDIDIDRLRMLVQRADADERGAQAAQQAAEAARRAAEEAAARAQLAAQNAGNSETNAERDSETAQGAATSASHDAQAAHGSAVAAGTAATSALNNAANAEGAERQAEAALAEIRRLINEANTSLPIHRPIADIDIFSFLNPLDRTWEDRTVETPAAAFPTMVSRILQKDTLFGTDIVPNANTLVTNRGEYLQYSTGTGQFYFYLTFYDGRNDVPLVIDATSSDRETGTPQVKGLIRWEEDATAEFLDAPIKCEFTGGILAQIADGFAQTNDITYIYSWERIFDIWYRHVDDGTEGDWTLITREWTQVGTDPHARGFRPPFTPMALFDSSRNWSAHTFNEGGGIRHTLTDTATYEDTFRDGILKYPERRGYVPVTDLTSSEVAAGSDGLRPENERVPIDHRLEGFWPSHKQETSEYDFAFRLGGRLFISQYTQSTSASAVLPDSTTIEVGILSPTLSIVQTKAAIDARLTAGSGGLTPAQAAKLAGIEAGAQVNRTFAELKALSVQQGNNGFEGALNPTARQTLEFFRDNALFTGVSGSGDEFHVNTQGLGNVRVLTRPATGNTFDPDEAYTPINPLPGETLPSFVETPGSIVSSTAAVFIAVFIPNIFGDDGGGLIHPPWELQISEPRQGVKRVSFHFNNPFIGRFSQAVNSVHGSIYYYPIAVGLNTRVYFRTLSRWAMEIRDTAPLEIPASKITGLTPGGGGSLTTDQLNAVKALVRGATITTGSQDTRANPNNGFLVAVDSPFFDSITEEVQDTDNWRIINRLTPSTGTDHILLGVFIPSTNTTVPVTLQLIGRLPPFTGQHGTGRYTFDPSQTDPRAAGATRENFAVINSIAVEIGGDPASGDFYFIAAQREGTPDPTQALSVRRDTDIRLYETADSVHITTGEGTTIGEVSLTPDDLAAINNAKLLVRDTAPVDDTFGETQWRLNSQSNYGPPGRAFNLAGSTPSDLHFRVPRDFGVAHNSGASRIQLQRTRPVENDDPQITFITDITLTDGHDEYFYGTYALSGSGAMATIQSNDQFSIIYPNIRSTLLVQEAAQTNAHAISRLRNDLDSIPSGGSSDFSAEQARKLRTLIDLVSYGTDVTDVWTRISANIASNNNMRRYGLYFHAANNISSSNQSVAPVQEFNDLNGSQSSRDFATAVCDSRNNTCRFYSHTHASGSVYGNAVSYLSRHVVSLRPPGLDFSAAGTGDRWQLILTFRYQINPNTPIGHNPEGADPFNIEDFVGLVRIGGNAQVEHNGALVDTHDAPISALNPQNNPNDDVRTSRFFLVLDPEHGLALNRGYREHARNNAVTTLPYSVRHPLQTGLTLFPDNTNHGADHFANATRIEFSTDLGGQFSSNVATIHFSIQKYRRGTDPLAPTHEPFGAPLVGSSRINLQERTQSRGNDTLGGQTIAYGYRVSGGLREFLIDITNTGGAYFTASFWYYTEPEQNIVRANNPLPLNVPNSLEAGRQFQVMMVISPDTFNDNTNTSLTGPLMSTRVFVDGTDYGWHNTWWRASDFNLFRIATAGVHMGTSRTDTADMGIYSYESIPSYGDLRHMAARIQSYIGLWQHDHGEVSTVDIAGEVRGQQLPDSTESKALLSADNYNAYFGTPHAFLAYHSAEIPDSHFAGFELESGATWVDGMWNERRHANNRVLRYARAVQTRTGLSNTHVVTFTAIHRCRVEVTYSAESTEPLAIPLNETNPASCSLVISNATSAGAADRNAQQVHCRAARTGGILNMNTSVLLDIGDSVRFAATGDQRHIRIHVQGFRIF